MAAAASRAQNYAARAVKYAQAVLAGEIPACTYVKLAVKRHLDDLERFADPKAPFFFDAKAANRVCGIIEHFRHIHGDWARAQQCLKLEDWQCFIVCSVFGWMVRETETRRFRVAYIEVPRKNAKALALDTPIPTPNGWGTIGELQPGDSVFDSDGKPTRITAVSETFTEQQCYAIAFSNGERIIADAGHLWCTTAHVNQPGVRVGRLMGKSGVSVAARTRTTQEIYQTQSYGERQDRNHSVKMPRPLQLPQAALPIDPYVLGAWLGDGTSAAANITCGTEDLEEMTAQLRDCGYSISRRRTGTGWRLTIQAIELDLFGEKIVGKKSPENFQRRLFELGVLGNKHIPAKYLRASFDQRLALLQGLMDTDGTISRSGLILSFTTIRSTLNEQVQELLASLGIKYRSRTKEMVCNGRPVEGLAHEIQFHAFRDELPVFRLARKLGRMRLRKECVIRPRSQTVQVASVDKCDAVPVKCLTVDSPTHMFLCGRSMIPTHNSTLTSAVGLYLLACDGEEGALIVSAANTHKQAGLVFGDSQMMARKDREFLQKYGIEVRAHVIAQPDTASKFEALSAEYSNLDGLNLHAALVDELHAHADRGLWDILETAMASRSQPLLWAITTAGTDRAGLCYDQRAHVISVLEGNIVDEAYFGLIYTRDPADDPWDEATWIKCNPNWGVSIFPANIQREAVTSQSMPSAHNAFLSKHLNIWVNADSAWLPAGAWDKCKSAGLDPEDFTGQRCYIGVDLGLRLDVSAAVALFPPEGDRDWYAVFGRYFLPEETIAHAGNQHYAGWEEEGYLTATDGATTDFNAIADTIEDWYSRFDVAEIAYDPYKAAGIQNVLADHGVVKAPQVEVKQVVTNMSPPMVELEGLIISQKIRHDGDKVLAWMMSNVRARRKGDLIQPSKDAEDKKIDGVTALLVALNRAMRGASASVYDSRGLWV